MQELRESGIDILGKIPWGSHFCNFYETKQDLLDTLIPYFKAGLENNEFCLWVVSMPGLITPEEAKLALSGSIPGFDQYLAEQKIEILNSADWYLEKNVFDAEKAMNAWHIKLSNALALGCDGMRVSGDEAWLNEQYWKDFYGYEKKLNRSTTNIRMIVLCAYPLSSVGAADIFDIVQAHQFTIAIRKGKWEVIEVAVQIKAMAEIKKLNEELQINKIPIPATAPILKYLAAVISVTVALLIALFLDVHLVTAPVSLFLCALMFSAWYGGIKPGLLALLLSLVAFKFFFAAPVYSLAIHITEVPRILIFTLSALFVVLLSANQRSKTKSLIQARNVLEEMIQKLQKNNAMLQVEITERKHAEDAIRQSEDRIRLIIDTIPTMAWSVQPDGTIDFVNQRWLDYTGLSLGKVVKEPTGIIHPQDLSDVTEKWRANMAAEEPYENEMRLRRADGEYRWFLVRTAPLYDEQGKLIKWYGVAIDIEDSKWAQDELRLAYQRLSYHFENTPLAVIELDRDLFIKRWSKRAEEIFGWEASEALGKNVYDIDFPIIYKEDIPAVDTINEQLIKGVVDRNLSLNRNYTKDGTVIYSEWYNSVLRDEQGNVITILSLVHDVTERKKTEETLNQSYEEIKRMTAHLQNIREEERIVIAREIHDELGQQLTVLKMETKGLTKKLNVTDEGVKYKIAEIIDLLDEMVKSVRRICSELRPSLLYNLGLAAAIEWHLKEFEKRSGIKTVFNELSEDLDIPDSIKNGLFRILQEALTNISRHANATTITVTLEQKDQQLILTIEDNGRGFEKKEIDSKKTLGILGMKERTQVMGGNYEINSIPGKGTTVMVTVPYTKK